MMVTYEEFKNSIELLRLFEKNEDNPCRKSDFIAQRLWLKEEYPAHAERLKREEMKE